MSIPHYSVSLGYGYDSTMRRPNLFIVGAPKCGTTSLHNYLSRHPACYMSPVKEPNFFSRHRVPRDLLAGVPVTRDERSYLRCFSGASDKHSVVGESSTAYLRHEEALVAIRHYAPRARIVAMVRDPVELVASYYHYLQFQGWETLTTLRKAWDIQDERCSGRILASTAYLPDSLAYRDVAMLGRQVERLHSMFPSDRVLILLLDDLRTDPLATARRLETFLGVEHVPGLTIPIDNVARSPRLPTLDRLVKRPPRVVLRLKDRLKVCLGVRELGVRRLLDRFNAIPSSYAVDKTLRDEMREHFRDDVRVLEDQIGRDLLQDWGWT